MRFSQSQATLFKAKDSLLKIWISSVYQLATLFTLHVSVYIYSECGVLLLDGAMSVDAPCGSFITELFNILNMKYAGVGHKRTVNTLLCVIRKKNTTFNCCSNVNLAVAHKPIDCLLDNVYLADPVCPCLKRPS